MGGNRRGELIICVRPRQEWQHESRRSSRLGLRDLLLDRLRVKGVVLGFMILVVSSVSRPNSACHSV